MKDNNKSYRRSYQAQIINEKRGRERDIGIIPEVVDPIRREQCKNDLRLFLETYFPNTFFWPFSEAHLDVINKLQESIFKGGTFALAMPRGNGKTVLSVRAAMFAILYGHLQFVVIIGAKAESADALLDSVKAELEGNDLLYEDFPKVCYPVRQLEGSALRCNGQIFNGVRTHMQWKTKKIIFPNIKDSPSSCSVLLTKGITAHMRGLQHTTVNGDILRPDLVILDDPQDDESAASVDQCNKREALINGAILGLGGHKKQVAAIMPCTIIAPHDVAFRMLDNKAHPSWRGKVTKMIEKWPDAQDTLWSKYTEMRQESLLAGNNGVESTEFYKEHREEMDKGSITGWEQQYSNDEISNLQHAENLLIKVGKEAFFAEYQNEPMTGKTAMYELSSDIVVSRLNSYKKFLIPEEANFVVVGIDINYYGLNYVVAAFCNDLTGFIVDYGKYPEGNNVLWDNKRANSLTEAQTIYEGIHALCNQLCHDKVFLKKGEPYNLDGILVDCGYMMNTVFRACKGLLQLPSSIIPARGRSSKHYKQTRMIGRAGDNWHKTNFDKHKGNVIVFNSDFWRMSTQKAFLLKPQAPGSLSLYGQDPKIHSNIAEHICAEILSEFIRGDVSDYYNWRIAPGSKNDLLDALVMTVVAAGMCGATATGGEKSWRAPKKQRHTPRISYTDI